MTAVMTSEQPAPRFRWYRGTRPGRYLGDGQVWDAEEFAEFLRGASDPGAVVTVARPDCVTVASGGKTTRYHGESPLLSLPPGSEADARRAIIRMNATFSALAADAQERADAAGADVVDLAVAAVLKANAALVARELADLAPSRSETAVEATR